MSAEKSAEILQRLYTYHPQVIDLSLREGYFRLLENLGNPHQKLPLIIHVAGTNGKGSTIAFLRAILEAQGLRVHVYTSPHLVRFHERIRLAGELISEKALVKILRECEEANAAGQVTFFELTTATAFLAFSRVPADILLLEVGVGGRLDATNVVQPELCVITRISHDHREYLGDELGGIAGEKAGIFKKGVPAVIAPQASEDVIAVLEEKAQKLDAPLFLYDRNWRYVLTGDGFTFLSTAFTHTFPPPALLGAHQYANAATAIAALTQFKKFPINAETMTRGLREVEWPARLQRLKQGPLTEKIPEGSELWLDGGHNDSAGAALATQAEYWQNEDEKPLFIIYGMLNLKKPQEFLQPLVPFVSALASVAIPEEARSLSAEESASAAAQTGISSVQACATLAEALDFCLTQAAGRPARILLTGSLYLAGFVLRDHG